MKGAIRVKDILKKKLKNKEFRDAFEQEEVFANVAIAIAKIREEKNLTQKGFAKKLGTSQQMVSRLEDPENTSVSLNTLANVAHTFNRTLKVQFIKHRCAR